MGYFFKIVWIIAFLTWIGLIQTVRATESEPATFAPLIQKLMPCVVTVISSVEKVDTPQQNTDKTSSKGTRRIGSGFIVDAQGYVLTNNHVVEDSDYIYIQLSDGQEIKAFVVGRDGPTDIALLQIKTEQMFPSVQWGDSDAVQVGDKVVAIGNPFGLGLSATTGIISARPQNVQYGPYDDFLQTDATIHQGNSGGPLFNAKGQLIGMNTVVYTPNGDTFGLNMAIPSNYAQYIQEQLQKNGVVQREDIGIETRILTAQEKLLVGQQQGIYVTNVVPSSFAETAGIQKRDIIIFIDDKPITSRQSFFNIIHHGKIGQKMSLVFYRGGQKMRTMFAIQVQGRNTHAH